MSVMFSAVAGRVMRSGDGKETWSEGPPWGSCRSSVCGGGSKPPEDEQPEPRFSDIRENWRLRVMREKEEREGRSRGRDPPTEASSSRNYPEDLPRSKSTPDGLDCREWGPDPGQGCSRKAGNGSLMDIYSKGWGGEFTVVIFSTTLLVEILL